VVVQHRGGGGGFARTLRLELPATDTWVIDLPVDADPERAVSWVSAEIAAHHSAPAAASAATATETAGPAGVVAEPPRPGSDRAAAGPGLYVEAHYDREGVRRVPVLRLVERTADAVPSGEPPAASAPAGAPGGLGPHDVLLVTGGGKGIGAECALALARASGCRLAIVGRSDPAADRELAANLERLRANGVQPLYLRADVADRQAVAAAVERAAAELGPVTALLHAAGRNQPRRLADLDLAGLHRILAPKVTGAEHLLAALQDPRHGRLRLVVAFGSIIARTGLHGEADYALANEWLERRVARFAAAHPACRCLVLEWSVWSGTGMGERLGTMEALRHQGIMPVPIDSGIAELLRLLADPAVAGSVVVAGRFGNPPTLEVERADLPLLRFLERPRVYFPGIELVADTEISAESDPYLADHVFRGEPLFAAVLGLEAMAQAAAAVTGARGLPVFENVELRRPIAVTPGRTTTIRLAALVRQPGLVEVALRDSSTGFATDHFRARCRFPAAEADADRERAGLTTARLSTARQTAAPVAAMAAAGTAAAGPAASGGLLALDPARDLYGGILFHTGRFRRLGGFRELRATECLAEIVPDGTVNWFGRYLPPALLLGDPAARDAAIHGIQACIPHAQLLPTGVERILTGHVAADEPLLLAARERRRDGDHFVYDLDILAADGSVRERWQGLHLRAVDRTRLPAVWSAPLLAPYLERRLQELLADDRLRVALEPAGMADDAVPAAGASPPEQHGGQPRGTGAATAAQDTSSGRSRDRRKAPRSIGAPAATLFHRPDGRPELPGGPPLSLAHAGGLALAVARQGSGPREPGPCPPRLGCDLEAIAARTASTWHGLLGADRFALAGLIARQQGESPDAAATRVWAAAESLVKAGAQAGIPLLLDEAGGDGWILLRAGDLRVATFTATLHELDASVALAVALSCLSPRESLRSVYSLPNAPIDSSCAT
jgi:enediyne polyketide synthase